MADAKGAYIGGVPVQFKDAAGRAMISDEYNSAESFAKGNLCIYNGKIYVAIKETTGTWDATAWEETTLAKVNGKLNGDIASLTEKMPKVYAIRRTIKANANLTVKFPEIYFSKPPVISVGVESSSVSISVVMNSTTKDSVVINNSNNTDFYFNLIAVEY